MSNVNTKLKDFYDRGYRDALRDCDEFMLAVSQRFGEMKLTDSLSLGRFLDEVAMQMNRTHGGNIHDITKHRD